MSCEPGCLLATEHPYDCETDPAQACDSCGVSLRFHDADHGTCDRPVPKTLYHWYITVNEDRTEMGMTSRENHEAYVLMRYDTNDRPMTVMVEVPNASWNEAAAVFKAFSEQSA